MKYLNSYRLFESVERESECSNPECDNIITDWSSGKCSVCGEEAIKPTKPKKLTNPNKDNIKYYLDYLKMIDYQLHKAEKRRDWLDADKLLDLRHKVMNILSDLGYRENIWSSKNPRSLW